MFRVMGKYIIDEKDGKNYNTVVPSQMKLLTDVLNLREQRVLEVCNRIKNQKIIVEDLDGDYQRGFIAGINAVEELIKFNRGML